MDVHGPNLDKSRGLEGDKSVLGGEGEADGGRAGELPGPRTYMELDRLKNNGEIDSQEEGEVPSHSRAKGNPRTRRTTPTPSPTTTAEANAPPQANANAARGKKGTFKVNALTDHDAPFPTLSTRFSDDVVINMMLSLQSKLFTFKWKLFLIMMRVKRGVEIEMAPATRWKRNPKWLMQMLGKECASMRGHLGAARQLCNSHKLLHLMQAPPPLPRQPARGTRREG